MRMIRVFSPERNVSVTVPLSDIVSQGYSEENLNPHGELSLSGENFIKFISEFFRAREEK
jgi:hypothetical protein